MLRERAAGVLHKTGLVSTIMRVRAQLPEPLSVLTYHSVADAAHPGLDPEVVDATPDQFAQQLEFICRYFSVVSIDDLLEAISGGRALPANPMLITFDDGYLNNHDTVLPLLRRYGAVATFFIATNFVEGRRLYWWDRINYVVNNAQASRVEVQGQAFELSDHRAAIKGLVKLVKSTPRLDIDGFLDELTSQCETPWSRELERQLADQVIMTWDQIRTLRDAGMDIQSHTRSHRILQSLDDSELDDELRGSREVLEHQLDRPVTAIAYPVGYGVSHLPKLRQAVARAGYRLGFTNSTGVNFGPHKIDPLHVSRIATERDLSRVMFEGSLAVPALAYNRPPELTL